MKLRSYLSLTVQIKIDNRFLSFLHSAILVLIASLPIDTDRTQLIPMKSSVTIHINVFQQIMIGSTFIVCAGIDVGIAGFCSFGTSSHNDCLTIHSC